MSIPSAKWGRVLAAGVFLLAAAGAFGEGHAPAAALKIGLLRVIGDDEPDSPSDRQRAFALAIAHLNAGGGVLGQPVATALADSTVDPETAAAAARRLIEVEGVHAIVGPSTSATTLPVAEQVTGPADVPTISPSATSPTLTTAADRDFLFRTALSDSVQGPVLARVTRERGFANVGVIYRDDVWGRGLVAAFTAAWEGPLAAVAIDPEQPTFVAELRRTAAAGAEALVVMTFAQEAIVILREALEHDLYDQFTFGDSVKSLEVIREVGAEHLAGMYGTAGAAAADSASSAAWEAAYLAEYGALPVLMYVKETYDAAVALALAAQAAGSTGGAAIRDRLRAIGSGPGTVVHAGPDGIAAALGILAAGGAIDYDGAAATLDWDENGDLLRGHVGIWRFTEDGRVEDLQAAPFTSR